MDLDELDQLERDLMSTRENVDDVQQGFLGFAIARVVTHCHRRMGKRLTHTHTHVSCNEEGR